MQEQDVCAELGAGTAADVLGASAALPKWTCDCVGCYGAGCGALLCFLAARELRGCAYLRPMWSADYDPAQASDNINDDI